MSARKYFKKTEDIEFLRRHYDGRVKGRASWIAARLGYPKWTINKYAEIHGLAIPANRKKWTDKETRFIREYENKMSVSVMAKHLGRSITSTAMKVKRIRIRRRKSREGYTMRLLELCFGCDHHTIERWIEKGWLRGVKRGTDPKRSLWYFSEADVLRFVLRHPLAFSLRHVDQAWFMALLSGSGDVARRMRSCALCDDPPGDSPRLLRRPTGNDLQVELWFICRRCSMPRKERRREEVA